MPCIIGNAENCLDIFRLDYKVNQYKLNLLPQYLSLQKQSRNKIEIKETFNILKDKFVFGMIAHFKSFKYHDLLLKTFKKVHSNHPNTHLILMGNKDNDEGTLSIFNDLKMTINQDNLNSSVTFLLFEILARKGFGGGSAIYYTTDGSDPDVNDTLYTSAGIPIAANTVLKASILGGNGLTGPVATFDYIMKAGADLNGPATHTIVLKDQEWNIFSVPKIVASFTADTDPAQTTLTGLVSKLGTEGAAYVIEGSVWKNLVTEAIAAAAHPHYQKEVPQPLYGYVMYNDSGADITVTVTYEDIADVGIGGENFSRALSAGWNSVGVADYQKALTSDEADPMNVDTSDGVVSTYSVNPGGFTVGNLGYVLDYTANANNNSVNFAGTARLRNAGSDWRTNIINLRETRGYLIFISQGSSLGGSQYRP